MVTIMVQGATAADKFSDIPMNQLLQQPLAANRRLMVSSRAVAYSLRLHVDDHRVATIAVDNSCTVTEVLWLTAP
jgi:hypothetical protein